MKTKQAFLLTLLFGFMMIFSISYGQVVQSQHEDSIEVKMAKLKIQAQHEMDSVKSLYEIERNGIKTEAKDSLAILQFMGESELAALKLEAQKELNKLENKAKNSLFKGAIRQRHVEKRYHAIENEYSLKASHLEQKYENAINRLERHYSNRMHVIESKAQLEVKEIESRYHKEMALLELEMKQ